MHKLLPQIFLSLLIFDGLTAVHILWRSNTDIPLDDLDLFPQNLIRFLVEFHTLWQFTLGIFFTKYNKNPFRRVSEMVFCYQYCSDLLWEKIVLVIEKNFWNSRLKAENFQNFWDHLNNLFKQWKVRTIFGNRMLF